MKSIADQAEQLPAARADAPPGVRQLPRREDGVAGTRFDRPPADHQGATDARTEPKVRIACAAPPATHDPVVYPIAVLRGTRDPVIARAFRAYLEGPEARAIFERHGFTVVP